MSLLSLRTGDAAALDAQGGEPRWSWRLFGLMAAAWVLYGLGLYISGQAEGSPTPWATETIWRASNAALWLALTPAIFWLTRAFPVPSDHGARDAAIHGLAALCFAVAHLAIFLPLNHWLNPDFPSHYDSLAAFFANQTVYRTVTGMITYGLVFFVFASDAHYRRARLEMLRAEELRRQLAEAQLRALRMQIQPHFLFNTLHSISALVGELPSQAQTMISRLGDFLRAALDRGAVATIRLSEEIRFAQLYLDIERVRFGDRLRVTVEVAPQVAGVATPSLILQPLVENAIRHGVAAAMGPVDLAIVATARDGGLQIRLRNSEQAPDAGRLGPTPSEGLGLANTRARLRQTYGDRASLDVDASQAGVFEVTLRLPMREGGDAEP